jgi:DNA-binding transcriptional LysR family regulator
MKNLRRIDLNLLVALDALLDEQNVTRAAKRLALTQPTVSAMLARLRKIFGDPLFVRTQRGILPTPRASALAPLLKRWLAEGRALVAEELFDPATAEFTASISANDYIQSALVVPFAKRLRPVSPYARRSSPISRRCSPTASSICALQPAQRFRRSICPHAFSTRSVTFASSAVRIRSRRKRRRRWISSLAIPT